MSAEKNKNAAHSFPLDGREVVIGRGVGCDICLDGIGVSRQHAAIRCGERPVVVDLDSTHGTRLDGNAIIGEACLSNGCALTVGIHILQVYIDDGHISFTLLNPDESGTTMLGGEGEHIIRIGRDVGNDIHLPHPMVSRFHAIVEKTSKHLVITDFGSANSTYVNGDPVGTATLNEGDVVHIGPFRFFVSDGKFCKVDEADDVNKIRIEAHGLGVRIKGKKILDNVNLTIEPGSFVALLGGSGAGKSTLSKILSGQLNPTSGRLFMNGFPAAKFGAAFTRSIGYVSQQILLRPELTVWETFVDQSLIRLPGDSTEKERLSRAEEILELMGLTRQRNRRVAHLSGGEARRLHMGIELLASPAAIILDEPLAGLDPGLIVKFMQLFRRISDKGHTLILITHTLEQIELCDNIVYIQSGRALFSGSYSDICKFFNVPSIADIYEREAGGNLDPNIEAGQRNTRSMPVKHPNRHHLPPSRKEWPGAIRHPIRSTFFFIRQAKILTSRYSKVYMRDRRNMILLMAQPPIITILLGFVYGVDLLHLPASFYFCLTVTGIWIGGLDAVREVAAELSMLVREMRCGMNRFSYITARVVTAAALSAIQALLLAVSAVVIFRNLDFTMELLILLFTSIFAGNILGLAVSACSGGVGRAISALPIVLIPQIFFSGILVPSERMTELGRQISNLTIARPVFGVMKKTFMLDRPLFWHTEWTELCTLCAGLIVIFWIAMKRRTGRRSGVS
ncbi:MAG: ATP-binding cassette domain-containing protein [Chitinispirillales bacterium]|jgi:ABC-type multidrug transport system ATPase subunit/pSer/pThr/pTyr-binding forkhead associated (FHA) protein|nr:ATP-binding cassette domain-containing protein [Chitinispirillales bacterium]